MPGCLQILPQAIWSYCHLAKPPLPKARSDVHQIPIPGFNYAYLLSVWLQPS